MDHLDVELAHRLIREQLDAQAQADWQRHLRDCPRCRDLLASERAFAKMLELGETAPPCTAGVTHRVSARIAHLPGRERAGRSREILKQVGGLVLVAALALSLTWQLSHGGANADAKGQEPRIPAELQNKTVANLDALLILARDPWLADRYEDIRTFEQLVIGNKP